MGILGIVTILGIVFLFSEDKKNIDKSFILKALAMQVILAFLCLKVPLFVNMMQNISDGVKVLLDFSLEGAKFIFANLADKSFELKTGESHTSYYGLFGFQFGILIGCTIIFFSSLISLLYHFGIMQFIIKQISKFIVLVLKTSGPETIVSSSNAFIGMSEAALIVKPYISSMTKSQISTIMISGFATIGGSVFGAYVSMGANGAYIILASLMSIPSSIMMSKILFPEKLDCSIKDIEMVNMREEKDRTTFIGAIVDGALVGTKIVVYIMSVLIAFISMIYMINYGLNFIQEGLSLKKIFGYIFSPLSYLMGIPSSDILISSSIIGSKISINEFVAFMELGEELKNNSLSARSELIITIAISGYANFSSLGMLTATMCAMAPDKKKEILSVGWKSLLAGSLVSCLSATIAGVII